MVVGASDEVIDHNLSLILIQNYYIDWYIYIQYDCNGIQMGLAGIQYMYSDIIKKFVSSSKQEIVGIYNKCPVGLSMLVVGLCTLSFRCADSVQLFIHQGDQHHWGGRETVVATGVV